MSKSPAVTAPVVLNTDQLRAKTADARARLLFLNPFFGFLVSNLEDRFGETLCNSAQTDGRTVTWSPEFLSELSAGDTMFVLAHEAMHCALDHIGRCGQRDRDQWGISIDMVVNDLLTASGLQVTIPALSGAQGKSAEALYEEMKADPKSFMKRFRGNGNGGDKTLDDHSGWKDLDDAVARQRSDVWRAALSQAKRFGKMPAGVGQLVESILNPRRDWRDLLRDGLFFPEDYRWTPTDRRFPDVLLPTLSGEIHRVVIAIDTSGSVCGPQLQSFWSELVAILRNNRCEARVLTCDAAIQNEWDEIGFDPTTVKDIGGGGGTSFVPVFDKVQDYIAGGWVPEAVVYLTDLMGEFPNYAPDVRTLWVVEKQYGKTQVPFGDVLELD